jgi:hypothetical protein
VCLGGESAVDRDRSAALALAVAQEEQGGVQRGFQVLAAVGGHQDRDYGAVIGEVPVVNLRQLPNSIKMCYPTFRDHIPLAEAARAHRDLESRATTGKLLLLPRARR